MSNSAVAAARNFQQRYYSGERLQSLIENGHMHGPAYDSSYSEEYGHTGLGSSSSAAGSGSSSSSSLNSYLEMLQQIQAQNNAWSSSQAQRQMDFQSSEAALARKFNHDEAQASRDWTQYMSDTAHQREVKDLQAAGLNPVLSAMGGNGAPVTSGAVAAGNASPQGAKGDTDTSLSGALVGLLSASMQAQASMANMAVSARTQEAVADKYTSMSKLVAEMNNENSFRIATLSSQTTLTAANINSLATRAAASIHADATKVSASIHAAAAKYGYDLSAMTQKQLAAFNSELQRDLKSQGIDADLTLQYNAQQHDIYMADNFPQTWAGQFNSSAALKNFLSGFFGDQSFTSDGWSR